MSASLLHQVSHLLEPLYAGDVEVYEWSRACLLRGFPAVLLAIPLHNLLVQLLLLKGCDVLDRRLRVMFGLLE